MQRTEPNQTIKTTNSSRFRWFVSVNQIEPSHLIKSEPSKPFRFGTAPLNHNSIKLIVLYGRSVSPSVGRLVGQAVDLLANRFRSQF